MLNILSTSGDVMLSARDAANPKIPRLVPLTMTYQDERPIHTILDLRNRFSRTSE